MARLRIVLVTLLILLLFYGCSSQNNSVKKFSESLSEDYGCTLNIQSETGERLFGGTLSKRDGEYVYVLEYPKQMQSTKYRYKDGKAVLEIGDISISVDNADCKICAVFRLLENASFSNNGVFFEKEKLYGEDCVKISLDEGKLYFANNKPLLILLENARVEITGFTYGKDDNFGDQNQESVA